MCARRAGQNAPLVSLFAFLAAVAVAPAARAYTIESIITKGCHEQISGDALRAVRAENDAAGPLPLVADDDGPLIDDLPFTVPADLADMGGATLLMGIRDNDLKGISSKAIDKLAQLNSDEAGQREHCLRMSDEVEPAGSSRAVDDCRAYILDRFVAALDGLDDKGRPDVNRREPLEINLALRGQVTVNVPIFYRRLAQGMHALQDSFTHTFRGNVDPHKINVVLNWVDYAQNRLDQSVGGPPHAGELDRCDDPDELRAKKHALAIEASAEAIRAALGPGMSKEQRAKALAGVVDAYVTFDAKAQCTAANNWCDAPERSYGNATCGCEVAGRRSPGSAAALGAIGTLLLTLGARRRRSKAAAAALACGVVLAAPRYASAQDLSHADEASAAKAAGGPAPASSPTPSTGDGPLSALKGESDSGALGHKDAGGAIFGHLALGASYDKPGFAITAGGRYQLGAPWMLGFDAEWNPWIAIDQHHVRSGVINGYASIIRRYQMAYEPVNFRTTASLGASVLLIDLVGAPKGSVGPFFGVSFLGVEWKVARGYYLVVDPIYIAAPIPHITGAPFGYYQYRFQVGLEFGG